MNSQIKKYGVRAGIATIALSAAAFVKLAMNEGYTDKAIIPVPGDVPTIGFGSTQGVKLGDKTTPVQALGRALKDIQSYENALKQCVHVPLYQAEYDAYVNVAYNIGPTAFCSSTIVKRLNAGDYRGACDAILMWKYFNGFDCSTPGNKRCAGLWTRRQDEYSLCMSAQD